LIATSATKEPALAVEILMDSDLLEIYEDGDLGTVVLVDKGKGVDPQEYGGALNDPKSMIAPTGITSTGGSGSIELVSIHRDKGKNADPEERGNGMAKCEPGPSQIDSSATKVLALAVEFLMDIDCPKDGGLTTVVLADKGKGVGGSDSIELVSIHRDKGKNVDPEERGNGMTKCEPGPSRIDFPDDLLAKFNIQEQAILLQFFERKRTRDLDDGHHYESYL
jgi:hypothetical protein